MGLTDKISEYYHKADDFILEKHIEVANWANYNFGKSNYQLSTYSAISSVPLPFASYAYYAATSNILSLPSALFSLGISTVVAYVDFKINQEMERREEISLESMVQDPYVIHFKNRAKFLGLIYFASASLCVTLYISDVINGAPFGPRLSDLSQFTLFAGWGAAEYFSRIDHKPKKKGRVPEAIENTIRNLFGKPASEPSGA